MVEIKCETIEMDGDLPNLRKVTILINKQPAWTQESPMSGLNTEVHDDMVLLAWLLNAIREQLKEIDQTIIAKLQELKGQSS